MSRILIAEDDALSRDLIARFLKRRGHQVLEAETGSAAWECIVRERPDVILADILIPEMNGFEILERLRRCDAAHNTPVILITGLFGDGEAEVLASASGAARLMRKPLQPEELLEAIEAASRESSAHSLRELPPPPPESFEDDSVVGRITQVAVKAEMRSLASRVSGERMRAIFDYSLNAILVFDDGGSLVDVNLAAKQLTGYSRAELLQMKVWEIVGQGQRNFAEGLFRTLLASGVLQGEISLQRKDGAVREIEYRAVASILPGLHVSLLADITQRKKAEQEVLRSRDFHLALLQGFPTPIWRAGLDGRCDYFNQTWLEFTGRPLVEELGEGWLQGVHPDDRERVQRDYLDAFRERRRFALEYRLRRHDGEYRSLIDHGIPFKDLYGEFGGYLGSCHDNTEQVETRRALQCANEKLHAHSQQVLHVQEEERRHLARELHDQIGQGLTAAKICVAGFLEQEPHTPSASRLEECVNLLDELTERVRELSLMLRPPPLEDLGLVPALRSYLDRQARAGGFHLEFFADPSLGRFSAEIEIACFRVVQEAITNVLRHAVADRVAVELRRSAQALHISVADNGVGFDPTSVQERSGSERRLGLLGMRERANLLGGEIDCRSAPGQGAEIYAFFPLASSVPDED